MNLSPIHRAAYAVSCSEVSLTLYERWYESTRYDIANVGYFAGILQKSWQILSDGVQQEIDVTRQTESALLYTPNADDYEDAHRAVNAVSAIMNGFFCCSTGGDIDFAIESGISTLHAMNQTHSDYRDATINPVWMWSQIESERLQDVTTDLGKELDRQRRMIAFLHTSNKKSVTKSDIADYLPG